MNQPSDFTIFNDSHLVCRFCCFLYGLK